MAAVSMSRRTIALILAVALAALATLALISYVRSVERKADAQAQPVTVFVAKQDIAPGVSGDTASSQGLITQAVAPAKVVPDGAITSLQQISGKIAAVQIYKDEIIVGQRFVAPGVSATHVLPIPPGKQAVSISIAGAPAVGGFVQPGDQVSLVVQTTNRRNGTAVTGSQAGPIVKYLMQNLDVIAVGTQVVTTAATPANNAQQPPAQNTGIFTFAVTPTQAEQLIFATLNTTLYFTLLPEKSPTVKTNGRTFANLFS